MQNCLYAKFNMLVVDSTIGECVFSNNDSSQQLYAHDHDLNFPRSARQSTKCVNAVDVITDLSKYAAAVTDPSNWKADVHVHNAWLSETATCYQNTSRTHTQHLFQSCVIVFKGSDGAPCLLHGAT
eukprot:6480781-Amphidinium_carterae.1